MNNNQPYKVFAEEDHNMILWLGAKKVGQAFKAQYNGALQGISILPELIASNGEVSITLYEFNPENKTWGQQLAQSVHTLNNVVVNNWLSFSINNIELQKGNWYGFKLQCLGGEMAIAEGARKQHDVNSLEWVIDAQNVEYYHNDFHLAYKIAVAA